MQQQQQQQTSTSRGNSSGRDDGGNAHMMVLDVGSMATALAGGAGGSSGTFSGQQQQQQQQQQHQQQVMPTSAGVYDHSILASAGPVLAAPAPMTTPTPTREVPNPLHAAGLYDASTASSTNGFTSDSQTSTPVQLRVAPTEQQQQAAPPPFQHHTNAFQQQQLRPAEHAATAVSSVPASSSIPPFFASMPALASNTHASSQIGQMAPPPAPPPTPTGNVAVNYPFPNALPSHVTNISNGGSPTSGSFPQQTPHSTETALRIHSSASNHSSSSSHGSPASSNELQQQQQQQNHAPGLQALPPLLESRQLTQEAMKWANGSEIALKAAEELAVAYNKIAGILSKGIAIEMTTRLEIRQDFVQAVAALDKAFFLSPAGPGYIGVQAGNAGATAGSRKRAFTVNSADDGTTDDPNKHRRTTSDAISAFSDVAPSHASSLLISPRSASSSAPTRPALHHHTHSSPLLPVESHYRPNSAGISDVTPAPKAADLATSGSHHVGKLHQHQPVMATHMSQSVLAADEDMPTHGSQAEQQQQQQQQQGAEQAFLGVHDPVSQTMPLQHSTTAQHLQSQPQQQPQQQQQQQQQMLTHQAQAHAQTQQEQQQQQQSHFTMPQQVGSSHAQMPVQTTQQQAPPIIAPIPQMPMVSSRDLSSMQAAFMAQQGERMQPPLDPQAYAQQALRTQDFLLAQAGSSLEPAFEPIQMPISQSSTPTPYQQQAYITPPMPEAAQFQTQHMQMGYGDTDMSTGEAPLQMAQQQQQQLQQQSLHQTLQQSLGSLPVNGNGQGSAGVLNTVSGTRSLAHHPGQLDFTTLRNPPAFGSSLNGVKQEDSSFDTSITSPYASSHMSMSSFPFTAGTSGTSVTSSSRSRAASLSKAVSASRSRAPSMGSMPAQQGGGMMQNPHFYPGPPDAHELENILGNLTSLPSPIHEDDDDEEDDSYFEHQNHLNSSSCSSLSDLANNFSSSQIEQYSPQSGYGAGSDPQVAGSASGAAGHAMGVSSSKEKDKDKDANSPELTAAFNDIFAQWLPTICADPDATDRKSEKIHQPLMAKKMQKLDEEHAFRPFKFRIQPFTNSFQDACKDHGLVEPEVAVKHVKNYLWNQPLISRFNDEGKKTKSRGNHVWSIEARYLEPGKYEFRPPPPKIVPIPTPAAPGLLWTWTPKVLDSQIQGPPMDARFSCTNTPSWLEWNDGTLSGVPPEDARSLSLQIVAEYEEHQLSQIFTIPLVADDGIRGMSSDAIMAVSEGVSPVAVTQTPVTTKQSQSLQASTSSVGSERTASTNSITTPPSTYLGQSSGSSNAASGSGLLPSPMTAGSGMPQEMGNGTTSHVPGPSYPKLQTSFLQQSPGANMRSGPSSPISPQQPGFQSGMQTRLQPPQAVPFYLPASHPTDATTLNNALHIKAKLVETTTVHHDNLSALNPAHPPADPAKVERAVDAAISHQLAVTSHRPQMPSATEVFNATLEVSTRSQQMQQEQLSQVVAAVTQQIQQQQVAHSIPPMPVPAASLPLSSQVTSQLADFSFTTPSNTPNNRSPDVSFHAHHLGQPQ